MRIPANEFEPKEIIKMIRESTEKTQEQFAKEIGYSKMTIQGYERGLRRYTFDTLLKIADMNGFKITIESK